MSETAVRVGLVDDQALVRKGLRAILDAHSGLTVAFEAEDGAVALEQLMQVEVDILLCDIRMPVVDGIEVVERLRQGANRLPVLLLTTFEDEELLLKATRAGANGYVLKDIEPAELFTTIDAILDGATVLDPQSRQRARGHDSLPQPETLLAELDEKERAVLRLMSAGLSNQQIAEQLHKAEGTIKNRVSVILQKLNARDRTQAVLKAITNGII
ncbi:MAG: response regulator transcription factor [Pseudomonadota bacterium]